MKKQLLYLFAMVAVAVSSCSKDSDPKPTGQLIMPDSPIDIVERKFGITIEDKDKLTISNVFISQDSTILTLSGIKDNIRWSGVYDLESKKIIFDNSFTKDLGKIHVGYGDSVKIDGSYLNIASKTKTHLYGERVLSNSESFRAFRFLFIATIGTNQIVEYNTKDEPNYSYIRNWFNGTVLSVTNDSKKYRVLTDDNETIIEGEHQLPIIITGTPISITKTISYNDGPSKAIDIYSIETNRVSSISYNPKTKDDDKIDIQEVKLNGNVAAVTFKVTSYENEIAEKIVKVNFETYKIVNDEGK